MGTINGNQFRSSYRGDQIDALLAAMAQANPMPSGTDWVAFIDDCREYQEDSEAYAVGTRNGTDVGSSDPTYHNNSKYYSQQAAADASTASVSATTATNKATQASSSAETAASKATLSQSWAVGGTGTRSGENRNNAKYWAEQASHAAGGGVYSFNNRAGYVLPQSGDYSDFYAPIVGKGKNLLDNWYFIGGGSQQGGDKFPINQQGDTSYTPSSGGYAIDRWFSSNTRLTLTLNTTTGIMSIAADSSGNAFLIQKVYLPAGTYTMSILAKGSGAGQIRIDSENGSPQIGSAVNVTGLGNDWKLFSGTVTLDTAQTIRFVIRVDTGTTYDVAAAKLELGDTQTLARQVNGAWVLNDAPPDFATELMKCLRYCYALPKYMRIRAALVYSDYIDFSIPLAVPLLTDASRPVIVGDANIAVYGVTGGAVSGFTFELINTNRASTCNTAPILMLRAKKTAHGLTDACLNVTDVGCLVSSE